MEVDASSSSAATAGAAAATSASAAPIEAAGSRSTRNYVVSAQKPTVVNACVVGNFRTPRDSDLIISRINRIEMMLVTEDGLKPHREIPIFGRIALIRAFKAPGEVCICFYKFCVQKRHIFSFTHTLEKRLASHPHLQKSSRCTRLYR